MNQLQTFVNDELGKYVRSIQIDDQPWFIGRDVADALGYGNGNDRSKSLTNAIKDHVDEDDKRLIPYQEFKGYQNGDLKNISHYGMMVINESGVYSLIFGSKLESARKFKHWVTSEVLPALRKHGVYGNMNPEYRLKCAEIVSRTPAHAIKATAHMLGFDIPDNCLISERRQKQLAENPLKDFIETIDEIQPFTPVQILWDNYLKWCESNSINPITRIDFSRKLVVFLDREIVNKKINGIKTRVLK
ncbi:MAG: hypothetical protein MJ170_02750 [Alphaproteobacteria bacterium]|nr:hypothetical protein [Alphaproteobacteria bacterium]